MKKLLFSLVAAAACGAVTADNVPATATFDSLAAEATFDVGKTEDQTVEIDTSNLGYWAVNMATYPELTVKAKSESDKYLSLNTGSTPLWRTFTGIGIVDNAKAGTLPAGVGADGKVVSSDVKLTACTEWPTLTDFANEKLALFLFAPEEGDTSGNTGGLYAVGGAMVDPDGEGEAVAALTRKAYKLTVSGNITNEQGWATISIKTYGDIYKTSGADKLAGFVIAVNGKIATRAEATGFTADDLGTTAATRNTDGTLIPAAMTTTAATIAGLGFQGEGGIDNVNLFADDFAVDAVAFTVAGNGAGKAKFDNDLEPDQNDVITVPASVTSVSFTLNLAANEEATVTYMSGETAVGNLTKDGNTYTFAPVANATLTITVRTLLFQANGTGYATFAEALAAALAADGKVTLLGNVDAPIAGFEIAAGKTVIIDLAGNKVTATKDCAFRNKGTLTITDSTTEKKGEVCALGNDTTKDAVRNDEGATLYIEAGKFTGKIRTNEGDDGDYLGTATITGGAFSDSTVANLTAPTGKKWELGTDSYYTLVDDVVVPDPEPETPEISDEDGSIEKDEDGNYVVETESTEITVSKLPADFTGKVVIPSTVEKINLGIGQLMVLAKDVDNPAVSYEITKALMVDDSGKLVLNAEVTVNGVPVKPALADGASETPFVVGETTAATVKTIPGLKYSLVWDSDLSFTSDAKGGTEPVQAKNDRLTLEDTTDKPTKRFYKVKVSK